MSTSRRAGTIADSKWNGGTVDYLDPAQWTPLASVRNEMAMEAGVDAGQTFALRQGTLSIDEFSTVQGTLSGFSSSAARVILGRGRCDAATYVHDGSGERLVLTNNGQRVGTLLLADTPDTQYTVTPYGLASTIIRPSEIYADGGIPGSITADRPSELSRYSEIDVIPSAGAKTSGFDNSLTLDIQAGSQLNQEGTIRVVALGALSLIVNGPGAFNNDGQLFVGQGSSAYLGPVTGSGTITVDGGRLLLGGASSAQTIDLLGGTVTTSGFGFNATIKDWNSAAQVILSSTSADSVQFNQTSDAGGDLQLFSGTRQVADLHLLGTYATSDFTVSSGNTGACIAINDRISPAG